MDTRGKVTSGRGEEDDEPRGSRRRWMLRVAGGVLMLAVLGALALREAQDSDGGDDGPPIDTSPAARMLEAARHGDAAAVARLLDAGVPVDAVDDVGQTALIFAIRAPTPQLVTMLLSRHADVNHLAGTTTPLVEAATYGEADMLRQMLEHGGDANLATPLGERPLSAAAATGDERCVRMLLAYGADASWADPAGDTAEVAARLWQHTDIADQLRAAAMVASARHDLFVRMAAGRVGAGPAVP